jgi:hypothetical protein
MKKIMGWHPEQFDNRYAFTLGVLTYFGQCMLNVPGDIVVVFMKAAIGGVGGLFGKAIYTWILKAYKELKKRKSLKKRYEKKP